MYISIVHKKNNAMTIIDLPTPLTFDWDEGNREKNLKKHNVSIIEAEQIFINHPLLVKKDEQHSLTAEQRFQALGKTLNNRKLFLAFTIRNEKLRVISVRDMDKKERRIYEEAETEQET